MAQHLFGVPDNPAVLSIGLNARLIVVLESLAFIDCFLYGRRITLCSLLSPVGQVHSVPSEGFVGSTTECPHAVGYSFVLVAYLVCHRNDSGGIDAQRVVDVTEGAEVVFHVKIGLWLHHHFVESVVNALHRDFSVLYRCQAYQLRLEGNVRKGHLAGSVHVVQHAIHVGSSDEKTILGQHTDKRNAVAVVVNYLYLLRLCANGNHNGGCNHHHYLFHIFSY